MRSNEITELSEIEHVLQKPGMYIGDVTVGKHLKWIIKQDIMVQNNVQMCPAFLKLFDEIISNSIDEAIRTNFKHANQINVDVRENTIDITDNGRGIPIKKAKDSDKIQALMAFTNLRAGGNFTKDKVVSIGTHGLGATLVNIMSTKFTAWTADGKKQMKLVCSDNMSKIDVKYTKSSLKYTQVRYTPDLPRFGMNKIDVNHLNLMRKRVFDLSVCYPDITFSFNGVRTHAKRFKDYIELLEKPYEVIETNNYSFAVVSHDEAAQISFANGIDTFDGGTHVDYMSAQVVKELLQKINKKYKKYKIKHTDIKNHLLFVLITNKIPKLEFKGQTKEKVTNNPRQYKGLLDIESPRFFNKILKNPDLIDPIIETYKLKQEAKERVAVKKEARKVKSKKVLGHVKATTLNKKERILYIAEGESASGPGVKVRDAKYHGFYPLKGKPKNVYEVTDREILSNVELSDLINIIGLDLNKPVYNLNYGKIRILADADVDGKSIVGSLLVFFSKWPELFDRGLIEVVLSPILKTDYKRETTYYYTVDEYNEALDKGEIKGEITYLKGLGSLTENAYKDIIHSPRLLTVESITEEDKEAMNIVYRKKNAHLRKIWLMNV